MKYTCVKRTSQQQTALYQYWAPLFSHGTSIEFLKISKLLLIKCWQCHSCAISLTSWHGSVPRITGPLWCESTAGLPSQKANDAELWCCPCRYWTDEAAELLMIWNWLNLLWPSDSIWRHISRSTFVQIWLVAWRHQAITWTNIELLSVTSSCIYLTVISQKVSQPSNTKYSLKISDL